MVLYLSYFRAWDAGVDVVIVLEANLLVSGQGCLGPQVIQGSVVLGRLSLVTFLKMMRKIFILALVST